MGGDEEDDYRVRSGKNRRPYGSGSKRDGKKKKKDKRRDRRMFHHKSKELVEDDEESSSSEEEDDDEDAPRKSRGKKDKRGPMPLQVTLPKGASRGLTIFLDFGSAMSMYTIPALKYESNEVITIVVERPSGVTRKKPKITFAVPKGIKRTPREYLH